METTQIRECFGKPMSNFKIQVPLGYNLPDCVNRLEIKRIKNRIAVTDQGLLSIGSAKPKYFLKPGMFYRVRILPVITSLRFSECISFQKEQPNNIFLGGQGILILSLTEHFLSLFPVQHKVVSLDEENNLFQENLQSPKMITFMHRMSSYYYEIRAITYDNTLNKDDCVAFFSGPFQR